MAAAGQLAPKNNTMSTDSENSDSEELKQFSARLLKLISRLDVLTDVFRHSIETEFYHSAATSADWNENLSFLSEAVDVVSDLIVAQETEASQFTMKYLKEGETLQVWVNSYKTCIQKACNSFTKAPEEVSHVTRTNNALESIYLALNLTSGFEHFLQAECVDLKNVSGQIHIAEISKLCESSGDSNHSSIFDTKERLLDLFKNSVANLNILFNSSRSDEADEIELRDIALCMESRKLYLIAHYFAFLFPEDWEPGRASSGKFRTTYQRLLKEITPATVYMQSARRRWEDAERYLLSRKHRLVA